MQKNDLFELEITDIGTDGEGIGHHEGMTYFVKDACIGDKILAKAMKLKKNYGYARVQEILVPSKDRVTPACPVARQCGGCQIQMLSYEKQLEFKKNKVRSNLIRLGGFAPEEIDAKMLPVIGREKPFRYRNKAQFPVGLDREGHVVTGFYASRTHSIIPVEDCLLGVEDNQEILAYIRGWMEKFHVSAYDETTGKGMVRHVLLRYGFTSKEVMVCLIINGKQLPHQRELVEALAELPGMTSISININTKNTNVILGDKTICLWGKPYIRDTIHLLQVPEWEDQESDASAWEKTGLAVEYQISPQSFYQVNPEQTEKLYSTALAFAGLTGKEAVWDLYCGIGTISLFLSQKARKVYGVEIVPQAIEDAKNNAKRNGITNAEFFVGEAEKVLPEFYENNKSTGGDMTRPDVIVVDPPRKGCDEKCLNTMLMMQPERIVYVSCDSATLARDLRILCDGGYELQKVQAVDQFSHSVHVETVCLLVLRNPVTHINIDVDVEELVQDKRGQATYPQIKEYVLEQTGLKVSSLYISQIKHKCGLDVGENYNKPKSEDAHVPQCPPEKEKAIKEALRHFGMI